MVDFVRGDLPAEYCELIQAHLASCDACFHFAASYCATVRAAGRLPPPPLSPRLRQRFLRAVRDLKRRREPED
jgi:anti-sigma factor RsiW